MERIHPTGEEPSQQEDFVYAETGDIIRFHVKANSNSPGDQGIKNYLAEKIIRLYEPVWSQCESSEELRLLLSENEEAMENTAREILAEKGFTYDVNVSLEKGLFPARFYAGEFYPPGEYEALYMVIGEGTGENWWCVLFPPLCFAVVPSPSLSMGNADHEQAGQKAELSLAESGKKDDFDNKVGKKNSGNEKIKIRFWVIELFQKLRI
ncbi:MAG: stage II sporulation protein R [Bacillota bacterium]|nr:stage II sporulation protein R [Bacillota bacterium]